MAINARDRGLPDWLTRIRTGQTKLPRFQRYEAWGHEQVARLFNTILRDLPAGSVLVLEIGNNEPFVSRPIEGAGDGQERVTEHLLDGQQRITALWRGLKNNYPDRTYFLHLSPDPDEETGMPYHVDSTPRNSKRGDNRRYPLWADDPKQQWERRMIPLDIFDPGDDSVQKFFDWADNAGIKEDRMVFGTIAQVRQKLASFNLPYLSLPAQTEPHVALDVFIKTNTSLAPLDDYDIVVAQVEAQTSESLHDLVAGTREVCPGIVRYYQPESLALAASAFLQGSRATKLTYFSSGFGSRLVSNWEKYRRGVTRTVAFLEEENVFDSERLPTDVIIPVLVAIWAEVPDGGDGEGRARTILSKYIWRASFTKRYERSTGTRTLADYHELRAYVTNHSAPLPGILKDDENPLPENSELVEAGWPKKKDRLARAILALSLRQGGLDLADGSPATVANLTKREYHHLFPVARLRESETPDSKIFRALNCALVSWRTNRAMAAKEPERYLAERRQDNDPTDLQIRERLASHLIPYNEMIAGDYDDFLQKRADLVGQAMRDICS